MILTIREKDSGAILASGELGPTVVKYEGNLYFAPEAVEASLLETTDRTGTCPSKGTYRWVDYRAEDGTTVSGVAWVYPEPKPGHEMIRGRYGFYAGLRGSTRQD
jgi:uncharacterized protein (DUF427 family)